MTAELKAKFEGSWTVYKSENWEAYLDTLDVPEERKKVMLTSKPTHEISVDGDNITMKLTAGTFSTQSTFTLGKETQVNMEIVAKIFAEYKDGKLIVLATAVDEPGKQQKTTREIVNGEMVQTMEAKGVVCTRYLKKN